MKKIFCIVACCICMLGVTACTGAELKSENTTSSTNSANTTKVEASQSTTENTEPTQGESPFLTEIIWTNNGSDEGENWLKIAVENENYDGDVIKAGTYTVKHTNNRDVFGIQDERVYNIFVSSESIEDPADIDIYWLETTIGGYNLTEDEITVKKGDYVYIQKVTGGSRGHIQMNLNET